MEFPDVGRHCSEVSCNKLDFLPIKCDVCSQIFCNEHYFYTKHNCSNAYQKDNQVPVCPLCNKPIPVAQGQLPDQVVGTHIDNDCQSDPAKKKRKVFTNKCSVKGCKIKEVVPVVCLECSFNFCLKHRHPQDHSCQGKQADFHHKNLNATLTRQNKCQPNNVDCYINHDLHGNMMSEDEALARALTLSMQDASNNKALTQEDFDLALARQLQASEYQNGTENRTGSRDRCAVL